MVPNDVCFDSKLCYAAAECFNIFIHVILIKYSWKFFCEFEIDSLFEYILVKVRLSIGVFGRGENHFPGK